MPRTKAPPKITSFKQLQRCIRQAGWSLKPGGKHMKAVSPDGTRTFVFSAMGGRHARSLENAVATWRRLNREGGPHV